MQSDCPLHSSSLPDQPRDIKLSKRPLDSIVTNEGPSKRSSSKQPSESRVFPAVDSFVQRLAKDSICSKQIQYQIDNLIAPLDTTIRELRFQHGKNGKDFAA
jgi:hypothetical protein